MEESPNLTDPFIFKVSADSLRQPIFFTSPQRNEILVITCALQNEASKRLNGEQITQNQDQTRDEFTEYSDDELSEDSEESLRGMYEVLFDYLPEDARLLKVE